MKLARGKYFVTKLNYIFIRKFPSLGNILASFAEHFFVHSNKNIANNNNNSSSNNRILQFLDDLLNSMYGNNKKENVSFSDVTLWGNINLMESQVSISPTFYEQLFRTQVFRAAILYLQLRFVFFGKRKSAQKLFVKCWWNWLKDDVTGSVISNVGCNQAKFNELKTFLANYGIGRVGMHYCGFNTTNPCCNVSNIFTENIVRDNFESFLRILKYSQLTSTQKDADSSFNTFVNRLWKLF